MKKDKNVTKKTSPAHSAITESTQPYVVLYSYQKEDQTEDESSTYHSSCVVVDLRKATELGRYDEIYADSDEYSVQYTRYIYMSETGRYFHLDVSPHGGSTVGELVGRLQAAVNLSTIKPEQLTPDGREFLKSFIAENKLV